MFLYSRHQNLTEWRPWTTASDKPWTSRTRQSLGKCFWRRDSAESRWASRSTSTSGRLQPRQPGNALVKGCSPCSKRMITLLVEMLTLAIAFRKTRSTKKTQSCLFSVRTAGWPFATDACQNQQHSLPRKGSAYLTSKRKVSIDNKSDHNFLEQKWEDTYSIEDEKLRDLMKQVI